jgi:hypothetical protein
VWWLQVPLDVIDLYEYVHILCQVAPNDYDFHYLKVPTKFLKNHLEKFHTLQGKLSLYFSTDPENLFVETRGLGRLNFRDFLVVE